MNHKRSVTGWGLVALFALVAVAGAGSSSAGVGDGSPAPGSETFAYEPYIQVAHIPDDVYYVYVQAQGGYGGGSFDNVAKGGRAGAVTTVLPITPHEYVQVWVGEYGWHNGGVGFGQGGEHGTVPGGLTHRGHSGVGGGGASAIAYGPPGDETVMVVAGGGGGGGGDDVNHAWGGVGGDGGMPAENGFPAADEGGKRNEEGLYGGCGGCRQGHNGGSGHDVDALSTVGGGGGGGGAGYHGGEGGQSGVYEVDQTENVGGSGGGGGSSWVTGTALDTKYTVAGGNCTGGDPNPDCYGQVVIWWGDPAEAVQVASGGNQSAVVTQEFAPIAAKVTDVNGVPVSGTAVKFQLPADGPSGVFPDGQKTVTVESGPNGVATVPRLTANGTAGQWTAVASVEDVSATARFPLTNTPAATTTVVTSSPDPSIYGEDPVIEAAVSSAAPALDPTGPVGFSIDGAPAGLAVDLGADGRVTLPASQIPVLEPGERMVEVEYFGDPGHLGSTSAKQQIINRIPTGLAIEADPSPSQAGGDVTLRAAVTPVAAPPGPPTGTVEFSQGETPLGSAPVGVDGTAEIVTDSLPPGSAVIEAGYSGDSHYSPASGEVTHAVGPEATVTRVSTSANPAVYGSEIEWTAVTRRVDQGAALAGTIGISLDGETLCPAEPVGSDGSVRCDAPPGLSAGNHRISAEYAPPAGSGDDPSSGAMTQVVRPARTRTEVTALPEPSAFGQATALGATVTAEAGLPEGEVSFTLDGETAGTTAVSPGGVTEVSQGCSPDACPLAPGSHMIEADFTPAGADLFASRGAHVHRVGPAATSTTVRSSQDPVPANQALFLDATVTGPDNLPAPQGRVSFTVDGQAAGEAVTVAAGRARSLPIEGLPQGEHEVVARFLGGPGYSPSEAGAAQRVGPTERDLGTPTLRFTSHQAIVNRNGSLRVGARCFGERGASCRGRAVIRTTRRARIENLRRPGSNRVRHGVAVAIRRIAIGTGKRRRIRVDLNNVGGRILTASRRIPVRIRFRPDPGTAKTSPRRLRLRGVRAPVMGIVRIRATAEGMTARIACGGGDGRHCVGELNLRVKGRTIAGRGFKVRNGRAREVQLALPAGRYRPVMALVVARSEVRVGRDVTRARKVWLP